MAYVLTFSGKLENQREEREGLEHKKQKIILTNKHALKGTFPLASTH